MDVLNIYSISGLFYELYSPSPLTFHTSPLNPDTTNPLQRINNLFWAQLFSDDNLDKLHSALMASDKHGFGHLEKAALANWEVFKERTIKAPINIINHALSASEMFSWMEQLQIACFLFSKYIYYPFSLSLQDGFVEPTLSSKKLVESLFNKNANPYLGFLEDNIWDVLSQKKYKMAWINGQPKLSSLAIAAYIKKLNPDTFIALRNHSSEYFSLNKIDDLLINNDYLFSVVDCLVLDDSLSTFEKLEKTILSGTGTIQNCPNIIYKDHNTNRIIRNKNEKVIYSFEECINRRYDNTEKKEGYISPSSVINMKINPNTVCYWNKCSFCGINKKYKYIHNKEFIDLPEKIDIISRLIDQGINYIWFEDEAIPLDYLSHFADLINQKQIHFEWQARSRIDPGFTEDITNKLYAAGLREIRFGLESACPRILNLMNKFPDSISLTTVENTVKVFTKAGIHVHFPMIVGFPTETVEERIKTYQYLLMLKEKYKKVSYNINILMLDYASDLYKHYTNYGISSVSFPCSPNEFLGNMVNYKCVEESESPISIDYKRNEFMRETLYPWMPITALTKPYIFYRLSETIRNTLIWNCNFVPDRVDSKQSKYTRSKMVSYWQEAKDSYILYDWINHKIFSFPTNDFQAFSSIEEVSSDIVSKNPLLSNLLQAGLLQKIQE